MANPIRQISDLKDSVAGMLTGTDLSDVTNIYGAFERAARVLVQKAKMPEAVGRWFFNLYAGVYDYPVDTRIFGTSIIDLQRQGTASGPLDYVYKQNIGDFNRNKSFTRNGYKVTFEYNNGTPVLRVTSRNVVQQIVLDTMSAITGWAAGGNASNLAVDTTVYYQQPAALSFSLAAAGSQGYIEKTLSTQIDLTDYQNAGVIFLAVDLPSATAITSLGVRIGNDSTHYYNISATTGFLGAFQAGQYMLIALDMANATTTGTVDITKIDYVRIYSNYDGTALTNVRIGGFWIALPSPVELLYTTAAIFLDYSTGVLKQKIDNDNDYIILSDNAYTLYEHESAIVVAAQNGGTASGIVSSLSSVLNGARARNGAVLVEGLYDLYRADNPTQEIHTIGNWYNDPQDVPGGSW